MDTKEEVFEIKWKDKSYIVCSIGKKIIDEHPYKFLIREGYVIDSKGNRLHNLIMDFESEGINWKKSVDHFNRNTLDNRKSNLRIVDRKIQMINRKGITVQKKLGKKPRYVSSWIENGTEKTKSYSIKLYGELEAKRNAINYKLKKISKLPDYIEALGLDKEPNIIFED
jgi:hypothetical protein